MPTAAGADRACARVTSPRHAPLLTRRRTVDYCHVATALCPWPPGQRLPV